MSDQMGSNELRTLKRIAKKYRNLGYNVVEQPSRNSLPSFLQEVQPDLIATSEKDNVVIEIKQSGALKGSNDIIDLASVVSEREGWRFELVVVEADNQKAIPQSADDRVQALIAKSEVALSAGFYDVAYICLTAALAEMIRDVAEQNGISTSSKGAGKIARDLVFKGVFEQDTLESIDEVTTKRNHVVHGFPSDETLLEKDVYKLSKLCQVVKSLVVFQPA